MRLYLIRHGAALSKAETGVDSDAERPLSDDGSRQVQRLAQWLGMAGVQPQRLLSSPLQRARQTAALLARGLGGCVQAEICPSMAGDHNPASTLEAFRELHVDGVVIAVGHLPHLARLATWLVFGEARDGLALEPAGACVLELPEFPGSVRGVLQGLWNPGSLVGL